MFISDLGFLSGQQSRSLTKHLSPATRKCQFNRQERQNKEQPYKNMVVWRKDGCIYGTVGRGGWGAML